MDSADPGDPGDPEIPRIGGRMCSSEPPFHAQESQDDVSSQANSLKLNIELPIQNIEFYMKSNIFR